MRALLDTHALLWYLSDDRRLPSSIFEQLDSDIREFAVSHVSLWEIAIKKSLGKIRASDEMPRDLAEFGVAELPIRAEHVWAVKDLPLHHRDPFDRLLVAQAMDSSLPIVTADEAFGAYDVATLWS